MGFVGIAVLVLIAYAMSENRRAISWRLVGMALLLQAVFALLVLKSAAGLWFFSQVGDLVDALLAFTEQGARFIFGNLVSSNVPVGVVRPDGTIDASAGMVAQHGRVLRLQRAADHHLLRLADGGPLPPARDAAHREGHRLDHAEDAAHLGRGDPFREREHLPRARPSRPWSSAPTSTP